MEVAAATAAAASAAATAATVTAAAAEAVTAAAIIVPVIPEVTTVTAYHTNTWAVQQQQHRQHVALPWLVATTLQRAIILDRLGAYPLEGKRGIGQGPTVFQHRRQQFGIAYPPEGKRGIGRGPTVLRHRQRQSSGTGSLAAAT